MEKKLVASRPHRAIYIFPNLFTSAALMAAFASLLFSIDGKFEKAVIAIFVAMLMDGLDGRVARWTNTQSAFGAEYDSLADVISFGVAPAILIYQWALKDIATMDSFSGKLAWFVAFVYVACAALRLARFNVQISSANKYFFVGLPSPAAAAIIASFVWIGINLNLDGRSINWIALLVTLYAGLMMVSNFLFYSFKKIEFVKRVKFFVFFGIIMIAAAFLADPPKATFIFFIIYAFSGPTHSAYRFIYRRREQLTHSLKTKLDMNKTANPKSNKDSESL